MTHEEAARRNTMQNELKRCPFCGGKYTVNLSDCSECSSCVDNHLVMMVATGENI